MLRSREAAGLAGCPKRVHSQREDSGQRNRPFAGWSALVLLAIAEIY